MADGIKNEFSWARSLGFAGTARQYYALPIDDPLRAQTREKASNPGNYVLALDVDIPLPLAPSQDFHKDRLTYGVLLPVRGRTPEGEETEAKLQPVLIHDDGTATICAPGINNIPLIQLPESTLRWSKESIADYLAGTAKTPNGTQLFDSINKQLQKYIEFPTREWETCVAAWVIGSYFFSAFPAYLYLWFYGNKQTGKSRLLKAIAAASFNGLECTDPSPASIYRLAQARKPTLCFDELDSMNEDERRTVASLLRHGYKASDGVPRIEDTPIGRKTVIYPVYSPKAIASNYYLHQISDRCARCTMQRTTNQAILAAPDPDSNDPEMQALRNDLYLYALANWRTIRDGWQAQYGSLRQEIPFQFDGRSWELWSPLFAIAKHAGEQYFQDLITLAQAVEKERKEADEDEENACVLAVLCAVSAQKKILLDDLRLNVMLAFPDLWDADAKQAQSVRTRLGYILSAFSLQRKRQGKGTMVLLDAEQLEGLRERYNLTPDRVAEVKATLEGRQEPKEMKDAS